MIITRHPGTILLATLLLLAGLLSSPTANGQAIDGSSTIAPVERPYILFTAALPEGSCHPNAAEFQQSNCIEDHFPVGTPDFPNGFFVMFGLFDTGSEFVVLDNHINTIPFSTTVALGYCHPMFGQNCGAPFQNDNSLLRSRSPNIPPSATFSVWDFEDLNTAGGISQAQFENPAASVAGIRAVATSTDVNVRRPLLGAPIANAAVAYLDFTAITQREFVGPGLVTSARTRMFSPGDPAIPEPLFEANLLATGDTMNSDIDQATASNRFKLDRFTFTNGNNTVSQEDDINGIVADTVSAFFDTGAPRTQVTRAMANLLGLPPNGAPCLPPACVFLPTGTTDQQCYEIDRFEIFGNAGSYKYQVDNPYICVAETAPAFGGDSDIIIGMNFFRQTQILVNGPARELGFYVGLETFLFSTIETEIEFDIDQGRINPITITPGSPGFPGSEEDVVLGNVVFYWNIKMNPNSDRVAQNVRLWLFERIPGTANPGMTAPSYAGMRPGEFLLRYPPGDNTFPAKEDTALWEDYIGPFWQPIAGDHVRIEDFDLERENDEWPQRRALAFWDHPDHNGQFQLWDVDGAPLRVSIAGLPPSKELLVLFELKRLGRLYLVARPVTVNSTINSETDIDTGNCFLTAMVPTDMQPQLDAIRDFRDEVLMASSDGRAIADFYYAVSPPLTALARGNETVTGLVATFVERFAASLDDARRDQGATYNGP